MNDVLVREADRRGARLYVTGQWRERAETAVRETGIGVVIVGHRRSEEWGLRRSRACSGSAGRASKS
jgi:putative NIF3 family GTP cyclohydrolase 1 type 2